MRAFVTLERFNNDCDLVDVRKIPSRSFVYNFVKCLYLIFAYVNYNVDDITNNARSVDADQYAPSTADYGYKTTLAVSALHGLADQYLCCGSRIHAPGTYNAFYYRYNNLRSQDIGIQVGTDSTPVALPDYKLGTRISHGQGAGELEYDGCEVMAPQFSDPDGEMVIRRYFNNNSGGLITVNEVGIHAAMTSRTAQSSRRAWPFCVARDLVAPGIDVANTEMLRVTYTIQITV